MNTTAFLAAIVLIFVTEMGDKTQLMAVSLASRYDPKVVFLAVFLAMVTLTAMAVIVGSLLFLFLPLFWIRSAAAVVFIVFGLLMLRELGDEDEPSEDVEDVSGGRGVFMKAFGLSALAEMGDKTQIAAIVLTASMEAPLEVFLGATIGFALVTALGVYLGHWLGRRVERRWLILGGAVLFMLIGVVMLVELII